MNKFFSNVIVPAVAISMIYKYRYRLLNLVLSNDYVRKWSVKGAMSIPGLRSSLINSTFRK